MKKLSILCLLAIIPFLLIAQEKGIQFVEGTFAEALDKAAKENKNVFVDCYASWCGPCRYMANREFNSDTVRNYLSSRFVSFK